MLQLAGQRVLHMLTQARAGAQLAPMQTPKAGEPGGAGHSTFMRLGTVEMFTADDMRGTYVPRILARRLSIGRVFAPSLCTVQAFSQAYAQLSGTGVSPLAVEVSKTCCGPRVAFSSTFD